MFGRKAEKGKKVDFDNLVEYMVNLHGWDQDRAERFVKKIQATEEVPERPASGFAEIMASGLVTEGRTKYLYPEAAA
jgi:endonuclease V-like protein UPF0215 family